MVRHVWFCSMVRLSVDKRGEARLTQQRDPARVDQPPGPAPVDQCSKPTTKYHGGI